MRKPENTKKRGESREELWAKIRSLKTFTPTDLTGIAMDNTTINAYLRGLVTAGYLIREPANEAGSSWQAGSGATPAALRAGRNGTATFQAFRYLLKRDAVEPPRVKEDGTEAVMGKGRAQLWKSMKILKTFCVMDLVACSSTEEHPVAFEEARTYVNYLTKAGYLRKLDALPLQKASFRLIRWTGPRPPMIQRIKQVWDPNLKTVTWPSKTVSGER